MQIAPRPVHAVRRQVRDLRQVPHYLRELIIEGLSLLEDKGNQVSDSSVHNLSAEGHLQSGNQASNACVLQSWPIRLLEMETPATMTTITAGCRWPACSCFFKHRHASVPISTAPGAHDWLLPQGPSARGQPCSSRNVLSGCAQLLQYTFCHSQPIS